MCLRKWLIGSLIFTSALSLSADSLDSSLPPESDYGSYETPKQKALKLLDDITANDQELRKSLQAMTLLYQNSESLLKSTSLENKALKASQGFFWTAIGIGAGIIVVESAILVIRR